MELKLNDRVSTPHGSGVLVDKEGIDNRSKRYGVYLDTDPFGFQPVYYWPHEVRELKKNHRKKEPTFYCRNFEEGPKTCLKKTQCDFCFLEAMNSNPRKKI